MAGESEPRVWRFTTNFTWIDAWRHAWGGLKPNLPRENIPLVYSCMPNYRLIGIYCHPSGRTSANLSTFWILRAPILTPLHRSAPNMVCESGFIMYSSVPNFTFIGLWGRQNHRVWSRHLAAQRVPNYTPPYPIILKPILSSNGLMAIPRSHALPFKSVMNKQQQKTSNLFVHRVLRSPLPVPPYSPWW